MDRLHVSQLSYQSLRQSLRHWDCIAPHCGSFTNIYRWDKDLFPDTKAFLQALKDRNLVTALNMHPADGVRKFEEPYEAMSKALGRDPSTGVPIPFECTNKEFLERYFTDLHHPLEDEVPGSMPFQWIDWQQGPHSEVEGIDPLWVLNHFHWIDSGRNGARRFTFSRFAGPGSHRYPCGFSGVSAWGTAS